MDDEIRFEQQAESMRKEMLESFAALGETITKHIKLCRHLRLDSTKRAAAALSAVKSLEAAAAVTEIPDGRDRMIEAKTRLFYARNKAGYFMAKEKGLKDVLVKFFDFAQDCGLHTTIGVKFE